MAFKHIILLILFISGGLFAKSEDKSYIYPYSSFLYSHETSQGVDKRDVAWPLITYRRYNKYKRYRFLNTLFINEDINDKNSDWHRSFIPFIFVGKGEGKDYGAIFPFGGIIRDILGYDYINFWLFPLYVKTQRAKRGVNTSILWPLINYYKSPTTKKWSVLPIFGKVEEQNKHRSYFALWPFLSWGKSINPKKAGRWYHFWPLYGYINNEGAVSRTILWPLMMIHKSKNEFRCNLPFPLFSYRLLKNNKGKVIYRKISFWPIYQSHKGELIEKKTYLWPLINYEKTKDGKITHLNQSLFPLYWSKRNYVDGKVVKSFRRLWPFFEKDGDLEKQRYRFPSLWPASNNSTIERNFSRIFSLYERNEFANGSYNTKTLWGAWRSSSDIKITKKSWSFLWGLLATEKEKDKPRVNKLFWLSF